MTKSSEIAFKTGEAKRISNKETILNFLRKNRLSSYTYKELAVYTGLTVATCQKRTSDLEREGTIKIMGHTKRYSLYQYKKGSVKFTVRDAYDVAIKKYCPHFFDIIKKEVEILTN